MQKPYHPSLVLKPLKQDWIASCRATLAVRNDGKCSVFARTARNEVTRQDEAIHIYSEIRRIYSSENK